MSAAALLTGAGLLTAGAAAGFIAGLWVNTSKHVARQLAAHYGITRR